MKLAIIRSAVERHKRYKVHCIDANFISGGDSFFRHSQSECAESDAGQVMASANMDESERDIPTQVLSGHTTGKTDETSDVVQQPMGDNYSPNMPEQYNNCYNSVIIITFLLPPSTLHTHSKL